MLFALLGCGALDVPLTGFHDDAGFMVTQLHDRACTEARPCALWDTHRFDHGPQEVAIGRPCRGNTCPQPDVRTVKSLGDAFDGAVGVLARENPLLRSLDELGCGSREACQAWLDDGVITIAHRPDGGRTTVATQGR